MDQTIPNGGEHRFHHKKAIHALGMVLVAVIVIVALVRDRIVDQRQDTVSITGQGKVTYQPDTAVVTLGVQVDKVEKADDALNQLNDKAKNIIAAVKALNIPEEDIQTQNYSLVPQYDYVDGVSKPAGYSANEQLNVKVKNIQEQSDAVSKVIAEASRAGANQVNGVTFDVSNINDLKQQARLLAIQDARSKTAALVKAAGIRRLGKVVGWYENLISVPGPQPYFDYASGKGGMGGAAVAPQVPSGSQEVVIEINLNYEVK